jgi:large subunit ribosomal protein L7Ae
LFKFLNKYRPETKQEKKMRLGANAKASAKVKRKKVQVPYVPMTSPIVLIEAKKASLVVTAHDIDPIELVFLPAIWVYSALS